MSREKPKWPGPSHEQGDLQNFLFDLSNSVECPWSEEDRANLGPEMVEFCAVMIADGEICNGGFTQFLLNRSGELAEEAMQGFRRFGMNEFAELCDAAYNLLGQRPVPRGQEERQRLLYSKFGAPPDPDNMDDLDDFFERAEASMGSIDEQYYNFCDIEKTFDHRGFVEPICGYIDKNWEIFFSAP